MVDDAFGIARGAGGVIEGDGVPLVRGVLPFEIRVAAGDELLIVAFAESFAARAESVDDVDDLYLIFGTDECTFDDRRKLGVGDQYLRLAVLEHETDSLGVEPGVERIQHRARHRHAEMRFDHFRRIRGHQRHRIAAANAKPGQRGCKSPGALIGLRPCVSPLAVHDRGQVRIHVRGASDQRQRRERRVVGRVLVQVLLEGVALGHAMRILTFKAFA